MNALEAMAALLEGKAVQYRDSESSDWYDVTLRDGVVGSGSSQVSFLITTWSMGNLAWRLKPPTKPVVPWAEWEHKVDEYGCHMFRRPHCTSGTAWMNTAAVERRVGWIGWIWKLPNGDKVVSRDYIRVETDGTVELLDARSHGVIEGWFRRTAACEIVGAAFEKGSAE